MLSIEGFMPHGHCYLWNPLLLWINIVSDSLIALAYLLIPILLFSLVLKGRNVPSRWMIVLFGGFIIACGGTHLLDIYTIFVPSYWLSAILKGITAGFSVSTAVLLVPTIRHLLTIQNPYLARLEHVNRQLRSEIEERERVEVQLIERAQELEEINHFLARRENKMADLKNEIEIMKVKLLEYKGKSET